jgi:hypothetical protein
MLNMWRIMDDKWTEPELSLIEQEVKEDGKKVPLITEQQTLNAQMKVKHGESLQRFLIAKEKAAGNIFAHLSRSQHVHIKGIEDDPSAMWDTLAAVHEQQVPGMQFNAYNKLFGIIKGAEESLPSVAGCISEALICVQSLCPSGFTLETLDNKLALMAMLRALPCNQYSNFVSSLMCQKKLNRSLSDQADQTQCNLQPPPQHLQCHTLDYRHSSQV